MTDDNRKSSPVRNQSARVRVTNRMCLSDQWSRLEQVCIDYQRTDGRWQPQKREIYHRGHGAAVLLYNLTLRTVVLTRQFRLPAWEAGHDGFLIEVPAGIVETENPAATIRNETQEETGFVIDEPRFLFRAFSTPGAVTEQVHYFSAAYEPDKRAGIGGGIEEEGEDIEVLEVDIGQAVEWILQGRIIDAKTIVLVQYAQLHVFDR